MSAAESPGTTLRWSIDLTRAERGQHWHQPRLHYEDREALEAIATALARLYRGVGAVVSRVAGTVTLWAERDRARRELAELSDRTLRDVGLSRADVWHEASKPFWRA